MKKILLAVAAVATFASCSQNEEFENVGQKAEIKIGTTAVTRATVMETKDFKTFRAFGYAFDKGTTYGDATAGAKILDGTFTSTDGNAWSVVGDEKFYWPATDQVIFFGYSPELSTVNGDVYTYAQGYPTIKYTVNSTIKDQADFLVAQTAGMTKTSDGAVSLGFSHALTQIEFKLKGDDKDVTYTVTGLALKGIAKSGTYSYKDKKWAADTAAENKDNYSITGLNTTITGITPVELTADTQLMILMPQELSGASVEVTYSAKKTVDGKDVILLDNVTKTATITGIWGVGEKTVYTLVLKGGDEIQVTGSIEKEWTPSNNDADVNVKDDASKA